MKISNLTAALCAATTAIIPTSAYSTKNISTVPNNNTVCAAAADSNDESLVSAHAAYSAAFSTYPTFMEAYYEGLTTNYANNLQGSCGIVALTMLLSYFDTYLNDNIIPEQYDAISYGDYKNMISRNDSPGTIDDNINESTAEDYYNRVLENKEHSLHSKLIYISKENFNYYNSHVGHSWCALTIPETIDVLQHFLITECQLRPMQYGIVYKGENYTSDEIKQYIIYEIKKGYPVVVGVKNSSYSHVCIAYAYDESADEILFHKGWNGYSTRMTLSAMGYDTFFSAFTFFPHLDHVHSDNYAVARDRTAATKVYDYYCSCSDEIVTYKHDSCDFTDSYEITSGGHVGYCICGNTQTSPHSYDSSYKNTRNTKTHTAYCSCGKSITQSHSWTPFSNPLFPAGEYVKCRYCSFIKMVGNDDRIPIERPLNALIDGLYANTVISI